jgi:hypothetical protein
VIEVKVLLAAINYDAMLESISMANFSRKNNNLGRMSIHRIPYIDLDRTHSSLFTSFSHLKEN